MALNAKLRIMALGPVVALATLFAAVYVEQLLGLDPWAYWLPNLVGALIVGGLVSAGAHWVQAGAAIATTVATVVALVLSLSALTLAQTNESRLDRQDRQRFAEKIHVGEPPAAVYEQRSEQDCAAAAASDQPDCHPKEDDRVWLVVINASGIQVEDVWVTNRDGDQFIRIGGLERCSMYALPHRVSPEPDWNATGRDEPSVEFQPEELYFTDPVGHWRRPLGGQVEPVTEEAFKRFPAADRDVEDYGISPWSDMLPNCAG
jgi:hypothetical protein